VGRGNEGLGDVRAGEETLLSKMKGLLEVEGHGAGHLNGHVVGHLEVNCAGHRDFDSARDFDGHGLVDLDRNGAGDGHWHVLHHFDGVRPVQGHHHGVGHREGDRRMDSAHLVGEKVTTRPDFGNGGGGQRQDNGQNLEIKMINYF
jgi:hypothetical protein